MKNYSKLQPLQLYVRKRYSLYKHIVRFMASPGHRVPGHILGLGYTCILLVKLIKRLQNIILPDALFLYVGQPIKTREESNIPCLSVFPICSVLPLKGRPNIKLIDTCGSELTVSCQLLSIHSLNWQLIRTFFIIKNGSFWSWSYCAAIIIKPQMNLACKKCTVSSFNNMN